MEPILLNHCFGVNRKPQNLLDIFAILRTMARSKRTTPTIATISTPAAVAAVDAGLLSPGAAAAAAGVAPRTLRGIRQRARTSPELAARVAIEASQLRDQREQAAAAVLETALAALARLAATADEATWQDGAAGQVVRLLQSWQTLTGQASAITEERRVTLDLTAAAAAAVERYTAAGYTTTEALACLREDDPELFTAYRPADPDPADPADLEP